MPLTESQLQDILRVKERTEDTYDRNVLYIAAGTLVLSLTFVEKVVNVEQANFFPVLIGSWACLVATIIVNLVSHQVSSLYQAKTIDLYSECNDVEVTDPEYESKKLVEDKKLEEVNLKVDRYNKRIRNINWFTTGFLIAGMSLLVIFCSINISSMKKHNDPNVVYGKGSGTKGATISRPVTTQGVIQVAKVEVVLVAREEVSNV